MTATLSAKDAITAVHESRACPDCRGEAQRAPGFLRDRLIRRVAA